MASSVLLGPGIRLVAPMRSTKRSSVTQPRRRTTSSCIIAMWAAGPPKAVTPRRRNSRASSPTRLLPPLTSHASGLEQLDEVAGRVLDQDLLAARAGHDVVAERHAGGLQAVDLGRDVVDDEVDAVPAAGTGLLAVG